MKNVCLLIAAILFCNIAYPQSGGIDTTFNPGDPGFGNGSGTLGNVYSVAVQPDGKIIIAGWFNSYNGLFSNGIVRLNSDGKTDTSFHVGSGTNSDINVIKLQSDGKILIGGSFTSYNGIGRNRIARINSNGTLDTSFNPGTGTNELVSTISIQSNGQIIIGGAFTSYNGTSKNRVARINTNGSIDATFNIGSAANGWVYSSAVQSDGKILLGGSFTTFNGSEKHRYVRLNLDGSIDSGFFMDTGPISGADGNVYSILILNNGKIALGGDFGNISGYTRYNVAIVNTDGTPDAAFNTIPGCDYAVRSIFEQSDGKLVIGGLFTTVNFNPISRIARLNLDGSPDLSFNPGANNTVYSVCIQPDGKVLIGGQFSVTGGYSRNGVSRINVDGSVDLGFNSGSGANAEINTISVQSNGQIFIGGNFISFNGSIKNHIARLNLDGSLDTTFNCGTGANGIVVESALQSDGKILIGGSFTSYNGTLINRVARLNSNGTLDNSFNPGTGANSEVKAIAIQSDGKILIGGSFTTINGQSKSKIARLNSDGSLDNSFNTGTGPAGDVHTISIQSDGKIIVGGAFQYFCGVQTNYIARINTNGTLDTSFIQGAGAWDYVRTSCIQSDGKILIGGDFLTYNGASAMYVTRINPDGTKDQTFNTSYGPNYTVNTISVQSTGKIIISGGFGSVSGVSRNKIARLNPNGSNDASFNPGTGANNWVYAHASQNDGKILIGGPFVSYNGTGKNRLARIYGQNNIEIFSSGLLQFCQGDTFQMAFVVPNLFNSGNIFTAQLSAANGSFSSPVNIGSVAAVTNDTIVAVIPSGQPSGTGYRVRIVASSPSYTSPDNGINFKIVSPVTSTGAVSGLSTVCQDQMGVIYTVAPVSSGSTYIWTLPLGANGASSSNSISVDYEFFALSGNISVSETNVCGSASPTIYPVTVNPLPDPAGTITGDVSVCQGDSNVSYYVPPINNATSYQWFGPTGTTGVVTSNNLSLSFGPSAVSGYISVSGMNGCGYGMQSELFVDVSDRPETPIITQISVDSLFSSAPFGNQWYNQNGLIIGATNQSLHVIQEGTYFVIVTEPVCSSDSSNSVYINPLAINSWSNDGFSIFPNPFENSLFVESSQNQLAITCEIQSITGQILVIDHFIGNAVFNTTDLADGIYILKVDDGNGISYFKLLKQ